MYVFCLQSSANVRYKQNSSTDRYKSVCGSVNRRSDSMASYTRETGGHSRSLSDGKNTAARTLHSWRVL